MRFTWSLHGTGNGAVVPYRARAAGVRVWTLDGDRDDRAVSVIGGDGPAVHVVMDVPGRLELACGSVVVIRGAAKMARRGKRPHTDYLYFTASGPRAVTLGDVLDALGAPASAEVVTRLPLTRGSPLAGLIGPLEISVGNATWIKLFCRLAPGHGGHDLTISRAAADDDEWRRAQDLPRRLGSSRVRSAWEFDGTGQEWAAMIGA